MNVMNVTHHYLLHYLPPASLYQNCKCMCGRGHSQRLSHIVSAPNGDYLGEPASQERCRHSCVILSCAPDLEGGAGLGSDCVGEDCHEKNGTPRNSSPRSKYFRVVPKYLDPQCCKQKFQYIGVLAPAGSLKYYYEARIWHETTIIWQS